MNQIHGMETGAEQFAPTSAATQAPRRVQMPPAKGSCWYCERPVDSVRRFCSPACRDDYLEEQGEGGAVHPDRF